MTGVTISAEIQKHTKNAPDKKRELNNKMQK